tara:strand:+ start:267 stop:527 length:261 start_codon:yes stop_codon:yes gene_type:complete
VLIESVLPVLIFGSRLILNPLVPLLNGFFFFLLSARLTLGSTSVTKGSGSGKGGAGGAGGGGGGAKGGGGVILGLPPPKHIRFHPP